LQATALVGILSKRCDQIVVLPCGAGKSLLWLLPCFMELETNVRSVTVVISPLRALSWQVQQACKNRVPCTVYTGGLSEAYVPGGILLVSIELLESSHDLLLALSHSNRLQRIVIEEAHLYAESWRWVFQSATLLRTLPVPLLLLTATMPPVVTQELQRLWCLSPLTRPAGLSRCTWRPNIKYTFEVASSDTMMQEAKSWIVRCQERNPGSKVMLFASTKDLAEKAASQLEQTGIHPPPLVLHSAVERDRMESLLLDWTNDTCASTVMVCTSGLALAVDVANVDLVISLGQPYSLLDWAQMTGRAGRRGQVADCVLLTNGVYEGHAPLQRLANLDAQTCLRQQLHAYLDGASASCLQGDTTVEFCSVCHNRVALPTSLVVSSDSQERKQSNSRLEFASPLAMVPKPANSCNIDHWLAALQALSFFSCSCSRAVTFV
jgi:superfamily II DNA helicase RecQ